MREGGSRARVAALVHQFFVAGGNQVLEQIFPKMGYPSHIILSSKHVAAFENLAIPIPLRLDNPFTKAFQLFYR